MTPEEHALRLDLDERDVLSRAPGTLLPKKLYRAHWGLERTCLIAPNYVRPLRVVHTVLGRQVRSALSTIIDEENGWGILHAGAPADVWWAPNRGGYTSDVTQAGLYTRTQALGEHGHGRSGLSTRHDVAVPPARMRELVAQAIEKARADLERAEQAHAQLGGSP